MLNSNSFHLELDSKWATPKVNFEIRKHKSICFAFMCLRVRDVQVHDGDWAVPYQLLLLFGSKVVCQHLCMHVCARKTYSSCMATDCVHCKRVMKLYSLSLFGIRSIISSINFASFNFNAIINAVEYSWRSMLARAAFGVTSSDKFSGSNTMPRSSE